MRCIMNDIRLALACGTDIPVPELGIVVHQPTIREISFIGEQAFFTAAQTFTINKNLFGEGNFELGNTSNFQIFMTIMKQKETADKKEEVISLGQLIFPNTQMIFTPQSLLLKKEEETSTIDESNFEILQNVLKEVLCTSAESGNSDAFNPQDEQAKKIAEKLMRGRQRVAAQKGENKGSPLGRYLSILSIGTNSMSYYDLMNLTLYQIYDLMTRYSLHMGWDIDIRTRLAGGKGDSQLDDWMKNIH